MLIQITANTTFAELLHAKYYMSWIAHRRGVAIVLTFSLFVFLLRSAGLGHTWTIYYFIFVVVWFLLVLAATYVDTKRAWDSEKSPGEPYDLLLSDDSFKVISTSGNTEFKWDTFIKVVETKTVFLLYYAADKAIIIPFSSIAGVMSKDELHAVIAPRLNPDNLKHIEQVASKSFWSYFAIWILIVVVFVVFAFVLDVLHAH